MAPRPGSSANRIPVVTAGGKPGIAAERATNDGFSEPSVAETRGAGFVLFHNGHADLTVSLLQAMGPADASG